MHEKIINFKNGHFLLAPCVKKSAMGEEDETLRAEAEVAAAL